MRRFFAIAILLPSLTMAATPSWDELLAGVSSGQDKWLSMVPQLAPTTDPQKGGELVDAMAFSLAESALNTLNTLSTIDEQQKTNPALNRFTSSVVCAIPVVVEYDKATVISYAEKALKALSLTGSKGAECKQIMVESLAEIQTDERAGNMEWGTKDR